MISQECFTQQIARIQTAMNYKYEIPMGDWLKELNNSKKFEGEDLINAVTNLRTAGEGQKEGERYLPTLPQLYGLCEKARRQRKEGERWQGKQRDTYKPVPMECVKKFSEAMKLLPPLGIKDPEKVQAYRVRCMEILDEYHLPYQKVWFEGKQR